MPFLKSKSVCNLQWKKSEELAKRNGYRRAVFGNSHKEKFTGWFVNDMKQGQGIQTYEDGTFYEGEWVNGLRHGYGYLASKCSQKSSRIKRIYTGLWANDKPNGYGIKTFPDGGVYKGEFMKGKRHDVGHMYYSDGHVYTGMWTNDARDGVGRHVAKNGSFYEGAFKKDTKCGLGRYYHSETGQMQEGVWYMDKPQISVMIDDEKRRDVAPRKTQYEIPTLSILRSLNDVYLERAQETMKLVNEY